MARRWRLAASALPLFLLATHCGGEPRGPTAVHESERMTPASGRLAERAPPSANDARIAALADATNNALIEQARVAWGRAKAAELRHLAHQQVDRHTEATLAQSRVESALELVPLASERSTALEANGQRDVARLLATDQDAFDVAYLDTQLRWHEDALSLYDDELLEQAQGAELRASLQAQRDILARHQRELRRLFDLIGPPPFGPNALPSP